MHFRAWWAHYLHSVSAADPVQVPLSLLFLELNGYYVNAVQLHVHAADVLVRRGVDGAGLQITADPYAGAVSGVATLTRAEGTIWVAEHTRLGMSLMT